jgi:hypothetical protein
MDEALIRKIESLPEDVRQRLMDMPVGLLILKLREPALVAADSLKLQFEKELRLMMAWIEDVQHRTLERDLPPRPLKKVPTIGAFEGQMVMSDDFDDPLPEFEEYM